MSLRIHDLQMKKTRASELLTSRVTWHTAEKGSAGVSILADSFHIFPYHPYFLPD